MKTNELKKGDRVQLRNGWYATIEDNMRGNTRMATVEGFVTEMGSVYSHDIARVISLAHHPDRIVADIGTTKIEYTPSQLKLRKVVEGFGT